MKRTLGVIMLVAAVGAVQAQVSPTPPARPARPADAVRPAPAPRAAAPARVYPDYIDIDEIRANAAEIARQSREFEREFSRIDMDAIREQSARAVETARE